VQVPAGGQPILLLGNRQTVGGYTKIAAAVYPDLAVASQLRPGDRVKFQEIDAAEAHAIAWAERRRLAQVRRYLEREAHATDEAPARVASVPVAAATPEVAVTTEPAPESGARHFRISIFDIEFDTLVEEVEE
jgi:hypothetical protein